MSVDVKAGRSLDETASDRSCIQTTGFQLNQKAATEIVHIFQVSEKVFHLLAAQPGTRGTHVIAATAVTAAFVGTGLAIVVLVAAVVMMVIAVLCLLCWVMVRVTCLIGSRLFLFPGHGAHMFEVTLTTGVRIAGTVRIGRTEGGKQVLTFMTSSRSRT